MQKDKMNKTGKNKEMLGSAFCRIKQNNISVLSNVKLHDNGPLDRYAEREMELALKVA